MRYYTSDQAVSCDARHQGVPSGCIHYFCMHFAIRCVTSCLWTAWIWLSKWNYWGELPLRQYVSVRKIWGRSTGLTLYALTARTCVQWMEKCRFSIEKLIISWVHSIGQKHTPIGSQLTQLKNMCMLYRLAHWRHDEVTDISREHFQVHFRY